MGEKALITEYKTSEQNGTHTIVCPTIVDGVNGGLETNIKGWLLLDSTTHVLDFKNVIEIKESSYRHFVLFVQSLKKNNKKLYCINVAGPISLQISRDGMSSVLCQNKETYSMGAAAKPKAVAPAPAARPGLDVEFINPFVEGTKAVFETQANTPMKALKPYVKKADENLPIGIAGVISLSSAAFTGSISICFPSEVFLKIYENMVGEKHTDITSELEDAAGELLNMIFGHAKTVLNDQKGHKFEKAIPTVLVGEKLRLRQKGQSPVIILPFESGAGAFHIEVFVEKS